VLPFNSHAVPHKSYSLYVLYNCRVVQVLIMNLEFEKEVFFLIKFLWSVSGLVLAVNQNHLFVDLSIYLVVHGCYEHLSTVHEIYKV